MLRFGVSWLADVHGKTVLFWREGRGSEWGRRMGEAERKGLGKEKGEQGCDQARKILIN